MVREQRLRRRVNACATASASVRAVTLAGGSRVSAELTWWAAVGLSWCPWTSSTFRWTLYVGPYTAQLSSSNKVSCSHIISTDHSLLPPLSTLSILTSAERRFNLLLASRSSSSNYAFVSFHLLLPPSTLTTTCLVSPCPSWICHPLLPPHHTHRPLLSDPSCPITRSSPTAFTTASANLATRTRHCPLHPPLPPRTPTPPPSHWM